MSSDVCDGLSVVEVGAGSIAGSFAGMLFADYGARVVKIEPPEGDRLRTQNPSGFLVWNRGKESVVADLRTADGRREATYLIAGADVLIEGFESGVAEQWGLGYEYLRTKNRGLVYCSIKGFGTKGPYSNLKGYDGIVAAKSGVFNFGDFGSRPGPIFFSAPLASIGAGHMAFAGVLSALIARQRIGHGQLVEATLLQGLSPMDYFGTMVWQHVQRTQGNASGTSAMADNLSANRQQLFVPTQDGRWVVITQLLPHQNEALRRSLGIEDTVDDPRFAHQPNFANAEDAQAWEDRVWDVMRTKPYAEWERILLSEPDIAFELVRSSEEGLGHPQIVHNGEVVSIEDAVLGPVHQVGALARFADKGPALVRSAPRLGEHQSEHWASGATDESATDPESATDLRHPLEGVTILELGYFYAMPFGVTMAASLGARVIKFEDGDGDPMRVSFGVPELSAAKTMEGKESLALDLRSREGQEIAHELVRTADVFVNGFRSGVAERMGLDYDTLSELNPRLVYLHAAGYGVDGPFAQRPIYASVAGAVTGNIHRFSGKWLDPELTTQLSRIEAQTIIWPRLRGPIDGDSNASLAVLSAILVGIFDQHNTGKGQFLSTSMIGGNALTYSDDFNRYQGKPPLPQTDEDNYGLGALYRLYRSADGWVFLAVTTGTEWAAFIDALDRPELGQDPRFATPEQRDANDAVLVDVLSEIFATKAAIDWEQQLCSNGVACVQVFEASPSEFTCTDLGLRKTELVVEVEHPVFGRVLRHGLPVSFSETPGRVAAGCVLGQHVDSILAELGYSPQRIEELRKRNVVFGPSNSSS